jgi:hypothetical protein
MLCLLVQASYSWANFLLTLFFFKRNPSSVALWIVTAAIAVATVLLLEQRRQITLFVSTLVAICFVVPAWKYFLQRHKVLVRGPWDIPSVTKIQLD